MSGEQERRARAVAAAALLGFFVVVVVEHAAEPSLAPLEHMVSEYARTKTGWLMTLGFLLWALSLVATAVGVHGVSKVLTALLLLGAVGVVMLAMFRTQTSVGELAYGDRLSTQGRLHDAGSATATLSLGCAAAVSIRLLHRGSGRAIAALLGVALSANVALLAVGPEVAGLRQRLLLLAVCVWQGVILCCGRAAGQDSSASRPGERRPAGG